MKKKTEAAKSPKPMSWRDAVQFLINLAASDHPEQLRPGDRLNLIDDLRRYIEDDGKGKAAADIRNAETDPATLKPVIAKVRQMANDVAAHKPIIDTTVTGPITVTIHGDRLGERGAVTIDGSLVDVMVNTAVDDLSDAEPWQICQCPESGCGQRLFLAKRKGQIYCSHNCANASSARDYRTGHAKERAQRERARYGRKKSAGADQPREV